VAGGYAPGGKSPAEFESALKIAPDPVGAPVNPQSAQRERTLISFGRLFASKTSEKYQTWLEVNEQLTGGIATDSASGASFARKHDVFRSGLKNWLESLVELVLSEVDTLSRIAISQPSWLSDADPARWAGLRIRGLLRKSLRQEISSDALENAFRKGSSLLDSGDQPPPKSSTPAIEMWFRMACEGVSGPQDMEQPWRAPFWCYQSFSVPLWTRRGRPSHLTQGHTEIEIRSAQRRFAGRLGNALEVAEDRARVSLASDPKFAQEARHEITSDERPVPRTTSAYAPSATTGTEVTRVDTKATALPNNIHNCKTTDRRNAINAFILKVADAGRKITRKHIWIVAGYQDRTEFERYQRHDTRTTASATHAFGRVLSMNPGDFIALLDRKTALK